MTITLNHTPAFVTFAGPTEELNPITALLRDADISFEQKEEEIAIDLRAQGEGATALQKGAFVWDLVDLSSAAEEDV